ncbi:MAG: alanyl-tRNA editing protein [Thermoplasmataceae archaeon]|jgi:alanyl-tRNA synthetase/misacylated tRNA(Ala) deacylase
MATEALYLSDPYLKEAEGKVVMVEFTDLVVDRSVFFPTGEGQPNDKGEVTIDGKKFTIVDTWKDGLWIHLMSLDTYPQDIAGKTVKQSIDWGIRYGHMKFRTALYIISGLAYKKYNAQVRINQTYEDYAWIDIMVDNITEEMVKEFESETNAIINSGIDIKYSFMTREQFSRDTELMGFVKNKIPDYESIKVAKIGDLPPMPDLGTQVRNTKEVGGIKIKTTLVKGKISNRLIINLV